MFYLIVSQLSTPVNFHLEAAQGFKGRDEARSVERAAVMGSMDSPPAMQSSFGRDDFSDRGKLHG